MTASAIGHEVFLLFVPGLLNLPTPPPFAPVRAPSPCLSITEPSMWGLLAFFTRRTVRFTLRTPPWEKLLFHRRKSGNSDIARKKGMCWSWKGLKLKKRTGFCVFALLRCLCIYFEVQLQRANWTINVYILLLLPLICYGPESVCSRWILLAHASE